MKKNRKKTRALQQQLQQPSSPLPAEKTYILLAAVLLLALLVRVIGLAGFYRSIYSGYLVYDETVYQNWALHILQGKHFAVHDFSPLPAYVMAALYRLFSSTDPASVRGLNILFGVLACLFIYLIGRDLANKTVGLLACLIAALYKPFVFLDMTILKEPLGILLFSASIWLFVSLLKNAEQDEGTLSSHAKLLFLGINAGLLINVRQNSVVLLPVFFFFLFLPSPGRTFSPGKTVLSAAVYLIGLAIAIAPFLVVNYRTTGEFAASPAGGFNLYLANNPANPYPYYRPVPFATSVPSEQAAQFVIEASRRAGKKLSPREASSFWTRETIRVDLDQPAAFMKKTGLKVLALLSKAEVEDNYDIGFMSRFIPYFRLPFLAFWFVFPLGMASLILSARQSRPALALNAVLLTYALTLVIFFTNMRIRIPLMAILIPYAAIALDMLYRKVDNTMRRPFLILLALFVVIEFMPVPGSDDLSGHYNTHAINLASHGKLPEAIQYWKQSSAMGRPYSAYANLALAAIALRQRDIVQAGDWLNKIPDGSFAASEKYELLGNSLMLQGKNDEAVRAFEKSVEINSGRIQPRTDLIGIYKKTDPEKARIERQTLKEIRSFYPGSGEPG